MKQNLSFFKNIIFIETIDSTNTLLKIGEYPDKTVCYTFDQTEGRGRENRSWIGFENKSLAFSFMLENIYTESTLWLVASAALALSEILEKNFNIKNSWIKWPNDVYIDDKKIAGILAETIWQENKIKKFVVGIGINLNLDADDISKIDKKATSLYLETNKKIELKNFFGIFLDTLSDKLNLLFNGVYGLDKIKNEWLEKSRISGKNVLWINAGNTISGTVEGVSEKGFLLIKNETGVYEALSGEITVI